MAKIRFKNNCVEDYTIVLSNRSHQHYGQLTGIKGLTYNANFNSADEISFTIYKHQLIPENNVPYKDIQSFQDYIWDKLIDLKLIYVKELNEYFQIKVSVDDSNDTVKSVTGISQCEAELSQLILYGMEINSENDIIRDNNDSFRSTVFYDPEHPETSLLNRILKDKAPHYKIAHVDESLCELYRVFESIDGTSIYDFLTGECSEQFDCLFQFNSVERSISAYDLLNVCKECGKRGDFDKCPVCENKNLKYYGKDTTIYVDKTNLTDSVHLEVNSDSIKNCFKLEGGDEVMTSAIRSLNPTGTDYIYLQRQEDLEEMPEGLKKKLNDYYDPVNGCYYKNIDKYREYSKQIYDLSDDIAYYESEMMPSVKRVTDWDDEDIKPYREGIIYLYKDKNSGKDKVYLYDGESDLPSETDEEANFYESLIPSSSIIDAETEAAKLTSDSLNPISLKDITTNTSTGTVDSAVKNYAMVLTKSGYVKIEIAEKDETENHYFIAARNEDGTLATKKNETTNTIYHYGTWKGKLKVTNYSNKEDVAITDYIEIEVNDDFEEFIKQKVEKIINKNDDDEGSVFNVLAFPLNDEGQKSFKSAIKLYSLRRLTSFYDAIESVLGVLRESNQAEEESLLYNSFYYPYLDRLSICQKEMEKRQEKITFLNSKIEELKDEQNKINKELNLSNKLGEFYPIFCSYRREDKYSNSNYISDGLSNAKLFEHAKEFWETAEKELMKASNGECTITSTLYNLLAIPEFSSLVDSFELGNWIRVKVDGKLYRLRLIGYSINFDSLQTINVTFSTVTKVENSKTERENIIESAKSMATGISTISKQVEKGLEANNNINDILENGLNSGLVQIKNNESEEVIYDKHGILCRSYDDIAEDFDPKQLKLTHNMISFTDNNWKTSRQAIGEHVYSVYDESINDWVEKIGYGLTSDFVQSGHVSGVIMVGGEIYSTNYYKKGVNAKNEPVEASGSYINLKNGEFSFGGDSLYYRNGKFVINEEVVGEALKGVDIKADSLCIDSSNIDGTLKNDININDKFIVDKNGNITKITLPSTTTLPWGQVTNKPNVLSETDIDTIIHDTVTADYINSLNSTSPSETGVTGTYTIGDKTLRIVNGIIVEIQ